MKIMNVSGIAAVVFALAAVAFLIRLDLYSDDSGVIAFLIVATCFVLGAIHPSHAWRWAVLVAVCMMSAEVWNFSYGPARPGIRSPWSFASVGLFITTIGMIGAYLGAFFGSLINSPGGAIRNDK